LISYGSNIMHTVIFSHKAHRKNSIENADKYQGVMNIPKKRQITTLIQQLTILVKMCAPQEFRIIRYLY